MQCRRSTTKAPSRRRLNRSGQRRWRRRNSGANAGRNSWRADRRNHCRAQDRQRAGALGRHGRSSGAYPPPICNISTTWYARGSRRPACCSSIPGTASSTSRQLHAARSGQRPVRSVSCAPMTASISPNSAPASSPIMSSATFAACCASRPGGSVDVPAEPAPQALPAKPAGPAGSIPRGSGDPARYPAQRARRSSRRRATEARQGGVDARARSGGQLEAWSESEPSAARSPAAPTIWRGRRACRISVTNEAFAADRRAAGDRACAACCQCAAGGFCFRMSARQAGADGHPRRRSAGAARSR